MEPLILTEKRKSQRIPVELTVLAELEERRIAMCSDNISLDGMFLFSREFVRPCAVFPASVWISNEQEPLQVYLTSCFTERTWTGYGIGASISGISASDRSRWDEFYRSCGAARSEQVRQALQAERTVRDRRIVVVDGALSLLAVQGLRKQGLEISHVASAAQALEQIQREPVHAVVSDLQRPGMDGLALCSYVNGLRLPVRTILLTSSAAPKEFLLGLYAGATRVIAKPCSKEVLISRILEVLQQRLPGGRTLAGYRAIGSAAQAAAVQAEASALSVRQIASRASHCLGEVYRYVSGRFSHRAVASGLNMNW